MIGQFERIGQSLALNGGAPMTITPARAGIFNDDASWQSPAKASIFMFDDSTPHGDHGKPSGYSWLYQYW